MTGRGGAFATPTQQGQAVVGGPVAKGTPAERAAAVRRVRLEARTVGEARQIVEMLGLDDVPAGVS